LHPFLLPQSYLVLRVTKHLLSYEGILLNKPIDLAYKRSLKEFIER